MSNKMLVKFIFVSSIIFLTLAVLYWQPIYINQEEHESGFKVQAPEKLVSASITSANTNKSHNSKKATQVKTQPLTLTQALELAGRKESSLSPSMRLMVILQYYDVQQADEQARIAFSAVELAKANLRDTQALERAGVGTRFNVLIAQVNLASIQQALTHAFGLQRIERSQLAFQLGVSLPTSVSAADPVQIAGLWDKTLEDSIALVSENKNKQQLQRTQKSLQIEVAYTCLQVNSSNVQTTLATLEQAREALRLARLHFQAGTGTQTEVIEAENMLVKSEYHHVESILDYNRALAYLQRDVSSKEIASNHLQYEPNWKEGSSCSYSKKM